MTWNDQIGSRSRRAWLLFVHKGEIVPFAGVTIPGIVAVAGTDYEKGGKWSHTTYRLVIAPGVRAIAGRNGWEQGTFAEGLQAATGGLECDTWEGVANALGVTISSAERFLRARRPRLAERLDAVAEALASVDEAAGDAGVEELAVTFGSPTRRMREAGFWAWPVVVSLQGGDKIALEAAGYESCDPRVKVLAVEKTGGHGGGYISLRIAAPAGSAATHGAP